MIFLKNFLEFFMISFGYKDKLILFINNFLITLKKNLSMYVTHAKISN